MHLPGRGPAWDAGHTPAGRHRRVRRRAALLSAAFASLALLAFAPGALASTLSFDPSSGFLSYQASNGFNTQVNFGEPAAGTVQVQTNDTDPITSAPSNCTNNGASGTASSYTCTGVTRVEGSAGDTAATMSGQGNGTAADPPLTLPIDLFGSPQNDTLIGGNGDDFIDGAAGSDTLSGMGGNDTIYGDSGISFTQPATPQVDNDVISGGDGSDSLYPSNGTNQVSGGNGVDAVYYTDNIQNAAQTAYLATPVNVSLDGQANDGYSGNNSNIATDVEDIVVTDNATCSSVPAGTPCAYGASTLTGDDGPNSISGGSGDDTITGGGGADFLSGNLGNNTINAVDGFPDRVDCGGTGTANVDQLDTVLACTTTNTTQVANTGLVSGPPSVSWTAPQENGKTSFDAPTTLSVNVTPGNHPVTQVLFYSGERMVCDVKTAPYTCSYKPLKGDIGKDTLTAIATDSAGLTGTAMRTVNVSAFNGALLLKGSKLTVRKGKVSVKFKCASLEKCTFRFSIVIHGKTKKGKVATLVFTKSSTPLKSIKAGKTVTVTAGVNRAALSVLTSARGHVLSGKLTTRPRTAQQGIISKVKLVLKK